jgi:hypothetical protein
MGKLFLRKVKFYLRNIRICPLSDKTKRFSPVSVFSPGFFWR